MKKILLIISLIGYTQTAIALPNPADFADMEPVAFVDSLITNVQTVSVCMFRLPFWAQIRYASSLTIGALFGNLTGIAFVNLFSNKSEMNEVNTWNPNLWGKGAWIGTIAGFLVCEHFSRHAEFPKYKIKDVDKDLLVITITHYGNSETLLKEIKCYFAASRFPLVDAYFKLQNLHETCTTSLNIFKNLKKNINNVVLSQLIFALENIKNALLVIKNDPMYAQEQSNYTLMLTQQGLDTHNKVEIGSLIANIAHAKR